MHNMCKLYTILNHLTPKYLSDTLQSYQTKFWGLVTAEYPYHAQAWKSPPPPPPRDASLPPDEVDTFYVAKDKQQAGEK